MGNRAYFTVTSKEPLPKTYYMHWNGGMDTFAPLCRAIFDNNVQSTEQLIAFLQHLELKPQLQDHYAASTWLEENGHYYIDLQKQTLDHQAENQTMRQWVPHLKEAFESYVNKRIRAECRDSVRQEYWQGIIAEAGKFFSQKQGA